MLTVDEIKYGTDRGIYNIGGKPVGAYTHALPVFALPVYYALSAVAHIINLRLFFILVWLLAVSALLYYYSGTRRTKYILTIFALIFCAANLILYFFPSLYGFWSFLHHPLEFERWGEIAAINIVNIMAMCIVILVIYRLFKHIFDSERIYGLRSCVNCTYRHFVPAMGGHRQGPFFINNYLLFGNIFFPPMKATADVIVTGKIDDTAPFLHQIVDRIVLILESVTRIPAAFESMFGHYHLLPGNMVALVVHNDDPTLMSIVEVCPILIFALLMLYRLFVLLRTNARAIVDKERYLPFLFICLIIVHLLIYSRQTGIDYGLGEWDYRYFMPIYVPLLYFAISALRVYNVFDKDKVKEVVTALASCIVILTPALIIGVCVFGSITGNNDFYTLGIMCKIMAWIAITFLVVSFGFLALRRSERSKEIFACAIGFSIFSSFFWLVTIGFMWGKAPSAGFVLPAMNYLHGVIAYHAGLKFFMDTVLPFVPLSTQI